MKIKLLALMLFAVGTIFAQVSVGVSIGAPPPPHILRVKPHSPGEGYLWVGGYWYPVGGHYHWHDGYWTRPPYEGAHWVEPHHDGKQYFVGYWDGEHGQIAHDHKWDNDNDHNRDYDRH